MIVTILLFFILDAKWLKAVIAESHLLDNEPKVRTLLLLFEHTQQQPASPSLPLQLTAELALVGLHDALVGSGLRGGGVLKFALRRQKDAIDNAVGAVCRRFKAADLRQLIAAHADNKCQPWTLCRLTA